MRKLYVLALSLLCALLLMSCGNSENAETIYVLTPPQKASRFIEDLAVIAQRHGLTPNLGQATDDKGHTVRVIEAKDKWVKLWSGNQLLSGQENAAQCGNYSEPHSDPGQYIVIIDHRFPMIANDTPRELVQDISKELGARGYDVRSSPVLCSPLSKQDSKL